MCFGSQSYPPIFTPPVTKAVGQNLILTSSDATPFSAFHAHPADSSGIGVVVLPDMRGLAPYYEQLTIRLAEQRHAAVAIDYYGRTAGTGPRADDFPFMEHIMRVSRQTIAEDILAAIGYLRMNSGCAALVALGFCFGGRQAFFASARHFGFHGVIGFYGAPSYYPNGAPGPAQEAADLCAPILALFGGADHGISPSDIGLFDEALNSAGIEHEIVVYPGAPHSFFDLKYADHANACTDAWRRVLSFIANCARP